MALQKRDGIFLVIIGVLAAVLAYSSLSGKAPSFPDDSRHQLFVAASGSGGARSAVEKGCVICHNSMQNPLPENHPPKEQCLVCHEVAK